MKEKLRIILPWLYVHVYNGSFVRCFLALTVGYYGSEYLLQVAPYVLPEEDAMALIRYSILRDVAGIKALSWLAIGLLFINWFTPDDWFAEVKRGNMAAALVIVGMLYSLSLIICYA